MRNVHYVVKEGDTLWDLSAKFLDDPFEWHRLYTYNNRMSVKKITGRGIKDPDLIYVGQKLLIPMLSGKANKPTKPKSGLRPIPVPAQPKKLKELLHETKVPFATKYRLEDLPIIASRTPAFKATIKMSGSIVIKLADKVPLVKLTNKGLEASLKNKTENVLSQLLSDTYVGLDAKNKIIYRSMMVSNSTTPGAPSTAMGLQIDSDKAVPVIRGEIRYPKLSGRIGCHAYSAVDVKVVIEIEPKSPRAGKSQRTFREQKQPLSLPISQEAIQEGLKWGFLTGAALLVGTIATDFLSGGLGLADDLVTVPLALGMMGVSIAADKIPAQAPIQIY